MGLLDAYQDKTETAISVMAARPFDPEPAKPKHSVWIKPCLAVACGICPDRALRLEAMAEQ